MHHVGPQVGKRVKWTPLLAPGITYIVNGVVEIEGYIGRRMIWESILERKLRLVH